MLNPNMQKRSNKSIANCGSLYVSITSLRYQKKSAGNFANLIIHLIMRNLLSLSKYILLNLLVIFYHIQGEAHKMLQSDSTQTIHYIQKWFRQKFQCSKSSLYWTTLFFLSVEALKLHQGQLHFFKWNHLFFFDHIITDFKINSATYNTRSF